MENGKWKIRLNVFTMKIVFFGTPHHVIPIIESIMKNFTLTAVVTAPDKKAGRKQLVTPSPVKQYILNTEKQILILTPEKYKADIKKQLIALQPDLFIVAAYGKILPKDILDIPPFGSLCVHPSLLPKYRGPTPVQQTILDGTKTTGATIFKIDEQVDHGPIVSTIPFEVHETDTFETLMIHLFNLGAEVLPDVVKNFTSGKLQLIPQDNRKATYTERITKDDGYISLKKPPKKELLNRMIKAFHPWPGVWTKVRIKNQEVRIKFLPGNKLQVEGKSPMTIKDFVNGYPELKEIKELF